jgi:hypothetical protein
MLEGECIIAHAGLSVNVRRSGGRTMLASQAEVRSRIEELKQSFAGYGRQLSRLDLTPERRERLELDRAVLEEEIATLEKIAHLGRLEPDRGRVEAAARERLEERRRQLGSDPELAHLTSSERESISGETRALVWALGEDPFAEGVRGIMVGHERADHARADRELPDILIRFVTGGPNVESRASAAYELGKLRVAKGISALVGALSDVPEVAGIALRSRIARVIY